MAHCQVYNKRNKTKRSKENDRRPTKFYSKQKKFYYNFTDWVSGLKSNKVVNELL